MELLPLEPSVRVWSPRAVAFYAFFLAFPAGLILAVKNWLAIGRRDRIAPNVIAFSVFALPVIGILLLAPERPARLLIFIFNATAFAYFRTVLIADLKAFHVGHPERPLVFRPWYTGLGWALLGLLPFFLLFVLGGVALEFVAGALLPD